ncbi:MAG: AI-2E family transporter [Coprobacter sp.]|nr:AI-2E family transporter [Coprobacter sp.]
MKSIREPYTFDRVMRILFTLAAIIALFYLLDVLKGALLPFFVAWVLAYLINPFVEFIQYRCKVRIRILSIFMALLSIVGVVWLVVWLITPGIIEEAGKMRNMISEYLSHGTEDTPFIPESWHYYLQEKIDFAKISAAMNPEDWSGLIQKTSGQLWALVTGSVNHLINLISWCIVFLYLIFILLDYDRIISGFKALIPNRYRDKTLTIFNDVKESMNRYFRGQSLVAFLVGILFSIGFSIVGLPLAILLGLFIGLLNMVPYLQVVGFLPTFLLCLLKSAESDQSFWGLILGCVIVFVVVQIIQDMILVPRIMGHAMGLNPAIILLSLSIWGTLLGLTGMIIALPLTTLMQSYYERYILRENNDTPRGGKKSDNKSSVPE